MKTTTLKNNIARHLLLVTIGLALSGTAAHAQTTAVTDPVGITAASELPVTIADSLGKRAVANNFDIYTEPLNNFDIYTEPLNNFDVWVDLLRNMTAQLLAAEPAPTAIPRTQDELWSLSSGVAQELILELVKIRTTCESDYLKPATVKLLRDPAINKSLITMLVRSLR